MDLKHQDSEEVEVSKINVGEDIMETVALPCDEEEFGGDNRTNFRQFCGDEGHSENEDLAGNETEDLAEFGTEDIADSKSGDPIDSEEVETKIKVNPGYLSPRKKERIEEKSDLKSEELNAFVCNYCGRDFAQKGNLTRHEKKFHPQEVKLHSIQFEAMQKYLPKKKFRGDVEWKAYRTES